MIVPVAVTFKVASKQVSASLAKVRYSVTGAPVTAQVTATLRFGGKVVGSGTLPAGKGLANARVAISAASRKAFKKRTSIRLQLELKVTNLGTTLATKTVTVDLRRKK